MIVYTYDGSYDGLLSCVQTAWSDGVYPDSIVEHDAYQPGLLDDVRDIITNEAHAQLCRELFAQRFSAYTRKNLFYIYLAESPNRELLFLHYADMARTHGKYVDRHIADEQVKAAQDSARKVGAEAHRLKGLLRFRELEDGTYYAPMEPDHFILPIILPFFAKRLNDQKFIIHDMARGKAGLYDTRTWEIVDIKLAADPQYSDEEVLYQTLWRQFFSSIAIKSRINPALQRRLMPRRYWKHLVEMDDTVVKNDKN